MPDLIDKVHTITSRLKFKENSPSVGAYNAIIICIPIWMAIFYILFQ
jgi:hypothetical protein